MVQEMQGVFTEVVISIILALIALAGSYAVYYIKKATDKLKVDIDRVENEEFSKLVNTALWRLSEVATLTVNKIEQKTAKAIRESVKEGQLDKEVLNRLSIEAYNEIRQVLEPEYLELLEDTLGNAEEYILNVIEDKLVDIKNRGNMFAIPPLEFGEKIYSD